MALLRTNAALRHRAFATPAVVHSDIPPPPSLFALAAAYTENELQFGLYGYCLASFNGAARVGGGEWAAHLELTAPQPR